MDGVQGREDIAEIGGVLPDQVAGGTAVGCGLEQRTAVERIPDHVFLQPEVETAGEHIAVVNHRVVAEVGGVAGGGEHHDGEREPGHGPAPHRRTIGEDSVEEARPAEDRLGRQRNLEKLLRGEHQHENQQQKDNLSAALPEAPLEHQG